MTDLTTRLLASMASLGVDDVRDSTKKHIHCKLEKPFVGMLHIFLDERGKLLLFPDNLSM